MYPVHRRVQTLTVNGSAGERTLNYLVGQPRWYESLHGGGGVSGTRINPALHPLSVCRTNLTERKVNVVS